MEKKDKIIYKKLNKNIKIPKSYINTIYNTFDKLPQKKFSTSNIIKYKISIISACCCFFLITSIAFATDPKKFFQGILNYNKGITNAIENNYIEINNTGICYSNNVNSFIDSVLMDDYKLCISLSFELPSEYQNKHISRIDIPNIIIYDECNNILFNKFDENINYSFFDINNIKNNNKHFPYSYDIGQIEKRDNYYSFSYIINSPKFPQSKTINVKFDKIKLLDMNLIENSTDLDFQEMINNSTIDVISGKWNLKIDLSEKTYNRQNFIYKIKNYNNYDFEFPEKVTVTNTETKLEFTYNTNISNSISIEQMPYIKNENNQIFNVTENNFEFVDNIVKCKYSFDLNTFNAT